MVLVGLGVSACGNDDDSSSTAEFAPTMDTENPSGESMDPGRSGVDEQTGAVEPAGEALAEQTPGIPLPTDRALATTATGAPRTPPTSPTNSSTSTSASAWNVT